MTLATFVTFIVLKQQLISRIQINCLSEYIELEKKKHAPAVVNIVISIDGHTYIAVRRAAGQSDNGRKENKCDEHQIPRNVT